MPSLQIRELPADVYDTLSYRAEREGRSLAQQAIADLRRVPELEARRRRLEVLEEIRQDLERRPTKTSTLASVDLVREDRER